MKAVIVGGGKVGELLCKDLSNSYQEVTLIEINEKKVEEIIEDYDIQGLCGNGANYKTLEEAQVENADMFISVTASDEINMISCIVAKKLGVKYTIARVRDPEYSKTKDFLKKSLGIDLIINPDYEAAKKIFYMLKYPTAHKVESFSGNRFNILEVLINENSLLKNISLAESKQIIDFPALVCLVERGDDVIVPKGDYIFKVGDKLHITADNKNLKKFYKLLGNKENLDNRLSSALIIGAGRTGTYLVDFLQKNNFYIKVIENNKEKALAISELYPDIDVILADGSDKNILIEEGIETFDSCISLTGVDEENIIISLYADKLGVKKPIAKINRDSLKQIAEDIGQYSYVTPKELVSNIIAKNSKSLQCRKALDILNFYRIANNQVEMIEFNIITDSKVLGHKLKDLDINKNILIAFIVRDNKQIFPSGNDEIKLNDHVVIINYKQKIEHIDDILI